ncbi:MAG: hypothetical protein ACREOO_00390 [bacterium]
MDSYLTLLGSIVIGGLMLVNFMNYQADLSEHTYSQNLDLVLQETAIEVVEMVERDLWKIGRGVRQPAFAIYDDDAISFYADLENDGVIDTVRYYVSSASAATSTPNPNDRILYRVVNGVNEFEWAVGVTALEIDFYDAYNDATTNLFEARSIQVSMNFESTIPYDEEYASYSWRARITPPNLLSP